MKKKYIIIIILILAVSFLAYCFLPVINYSISIDNEPWRVFLTDRNWKIITDKAKKNWYYKFIKIEKNTEFEKALLLIEDKNYFKHYWVDIVSKIWAIKNNFENWRIVSWWSTITEQYFKNKFFIKNKRTYLQKIRESTLAFYYSLAYIPSTLWFKKNREYIKNKILNLYCHRVYFWNNLYGLWAALDVYFNKENIEDLTQEEIVILLALIHNPWIKSLEEKPFRQYFEKIKLKLWYSFERTIFKLNKKENIDIFPFVTNRDEINFDNKSTIDYELQKFAKDILNDTLDELKDKNVTNWAIFAINPKTKEILIYQWSRNFYSNEIDWQVDVIKSKRQPWSTMKPFLYLQALESWAWVNDLILDIESQYNSFQKWKTYISNNYSLKEYGLVRFKKALWNSFNNSTVRLAKELWLENVYNFYKKYNFYLPEKSEYYWYSLVLWNPSISLNDLVYSYSMLLPKWQIVKNIEEQAKFLLYDILSDPDNRDISFWVNSVLNTSISQAVKTGTSSNFRDNLVISYHPDFVLWVWVWNNDNSSMIWVTGITWAWYIWHQIIEKAIKMWYIKDFEKQEPIWIIEKEYCLDEKCFRKKINFDFKDKKYSSKIFSWFFSENDLFEKLTQEEIFKLENLWFYFK